MATSGERKNRAFWDADAADYQAAHSALLHAKPDAWGVWRIPEDDASALGDYEGLDVLELGCGAAQWSVAIAEHGGRATGPDQSASQLAHARRVVAESGAKVDLVLASATATPFTRGSFDVVFCDHGAMTFCDPDESVPEAARILRSGGRLVWCCSSALHYATYDDDRDRPSRQLQRSWFDLGHIDEPEGTSDWVLTPGEWIRVLRRNGFVVEDMIELRAPKKAKSTYESFDPKWSRRWPAEEIWRARKL